MFKWIKTLGSKTNLAPIDLSNKAEVSARCVEYLQSNKFEDASRLVASYEALQPVARGMGIDWSNHSPKADVNMLGEIFASLPKKHPHLGEISLKNIRVCAGMMHLWGVNNLDDLAPTALSRVIDEKDGVIAQQLLLNSLGKKYKYRDRSFDSVLKGFILLVTMQLRTPLSLLMRHGEVIGLDDDQPEYGDPWMTYWLPLVRTHKESGIDLPEHPPSTQSSDIGYIQLYGVNGLESDYHKFLVNFRGIAESKEILLHKRLEKIIELATRSKEYAEIWERLLNVYMEFPYSFFYSHLMQSPEISFLDSKKLVESGFCTINEIIQSSVDEFMQVKGIDPDKLMRIKLLAKEPEYFVVDLYQTIPLWYRDQIERMRSQERNDHINQIARRIGVDPSSLPRKILLGTWLKIERVINILIELKYDPLDLPKQLNGKPWVKSEVKSVALKDSRIFSENSFDSLWSDMRKLGILKVHGEETDSQERLSFNSGWKELKKLDASKRKK